MASTQKKIDFYITKDLSDYFAANFAQAHVIQDYLAHGIDKNSGFEVILFEQQFVRKSASEFNRTHFFELKELNETETKLLRFPIVNCAALSETQQQYIWLRQLYDLMCISAIKKIELPESPDSGDVKFDTLYQEMISKYKQALAASVSEEGKEVKARQFMVNEIQAFVAQMRVLQQLADKKRRCKDLIEPYCGSSSGPLSSIRYTLYSSDLAKTVGHNYETNAVELMSAIEAAVDEVGLENVILDEYQKILMDYTKQNKQQSGYLNVIYDILTKILDVKSELIIAVNRSVMFSIDAALDVTTTKMREPKGKQEKELGESSTKSELEPLADKQRKCKNLIDGYCGSGLGALGEFGYRLLSSSFAKKVGHSYQSEAIVLQLEINKAQNEASLKKLIITEFENVYKKEYGKKEKDEYLDVLKAVLKDVLGLDGLAVQALEGKVTSMIMAEDIKDKYSYL